MPEVILVVLQRPETAPALLRAAECFATLAHGAHLSVLATSVADYAPLRAAYDLWSIAPRPAPLSMQWHAAGVDPVAAITERGSRADLIVLARPRDDDPPPVRQGLRAALLDCGRPLLVVPPGEGLATFGRRVAIAWREDPHTVKAVLPALRYVEQAEAVFVLAGMREGRAVPEVPEVLAERNVAAELHLMPIGSAGFGGMMLAKAHELGADLIVMGAFAHNPLHNLVYGGVTSFVLAHADLPVLMRY